MLGPTEGTVHRLDINEIKPDSNNGRIEAELDLRSYSRSIDYWQGAGAGQPTRRARVFPFKGAVIGAGPDGWAKWQTNRDARPFKTTFRFPLGDCVLKFDAKRAGDGKIFYKVSNDGCVSTEVLEIEGYEARRNNTTTNFNNGFGLPGIEPCLADPLVFS
jgi:hypothetical protein